MADQLPLLAPTQPAPRSAVINSRCMIRCDGERRVVLVSGMAALRWLDGDTVSQAHAGVQLVSPGWATQEEVARAFGCTERTVRRNQRRFEECGMAALVVRSGWKQGNSRLPARRSRQIVRMKTAGLTNREVARRMGVAEDAIRKQVGPSRRDEQVVLPFPGSSPPSPTLAPSATEALSGAAGSAVGADAPDEGEADPNVDEREPVPLRLDADPLDRAWDRLPACTGSIDDGHQTPIITSRKDLPDIEVAVGAEQVQEGVCTVGTRHGWAGSERWGRERGRRGRRRADGVRIRRTRCGPCTSTSPSDSTSSALRQSIIAVSRRVCRSPRTPLRGPPT